MKTIKSLLAAGLLSAGCAHATDCQGLVTWIGDDMVIGGFAKIQLANGVVAKIPLNTPGLASAMISAKLSKAMGRELMIRFTENGVNCATYAYRSDAEQIWMTP